MGEFTYEDVDWNFRLTMIDWLAERKVKLSYGNKTLDFLRRFLERARRKATPYQYEISRRWLANTSEKSSRRKGYSNSRRITKTGQHESKWSTEKN